MCEDKNNCEINLSFNCVFKNDCYVCNRKYLVESKCKS